MLTIFNDVLVVIYDIEDTSSASMSMNFRFQSVAGPPSFDGIDEFRGHASALIAKFGTKLYEFESEQE